MMGAKEQENRSGWAWVVWGMIRLHRGKRWIASGEVRRRKGGAVVSQTTNDDALKRSDCTNGDNKLYIYACVMTKGGQQQGLCVKGRRMEVRGRGRRTKLIGVCVCVRGGIREKKLGGMGGGGLYFYRGDPLQGVLRSGHFCWSRCV